MIDKADCEIYEFDIVRWKQKEGGLMQEDQTVYECLTSSPTIANAMLVAVRLRNRKGGGCIYFDKSLKETRHGRHIYHNKYCAEITVNNVRYRHRSKSRSACEEFISEMQLKHSIR